MPLPSEFLVYSSVLVFTIAHFLTRHVSPPFLGSACHNGSVPVFNLPLVTLCLPYILDSHLQTRSGGRGVNPTMQWRDDGGTTSTRRFKNLRCFFPMNGSATVPKLDRSLACCREQCRVRLAAKKKRRRLKRTRESSFGTLWSTSSAFSLSAMASLPG